MRKRTIYSNDNSSCYRNGKGVAAHFDVGLSTAIKLGKISGAERSVGRRKIYDLRKIEEYLNENKAVDLSGASATQEE